MEAKGLTVIDYGLIPDDTTKLMISLAETDPAAALQMAGQSLKVLTGWSFGNTNERVLAALGEGMVQARGVAGALEWVRRLQNWDPQLRRDLESVILVELADSDPALAANAYEAVAASSNTGQGNLIWALWAKRDPTGAMKSAGALPFLRSFGVFSQIGRTIGPNPSALISAIPHGLTEEQLELCCSGLSGGMLGENLAGLNREIASMPTSPEQKTLLEKVRGTWALQDPAGFYQAIPDLPAAEQAVARKTLAGRLQYYPAKLPTGEVAALLLQIQTDGTKIDPSLLRDLYSTLALADPATALAVAQQADHPSQGGDLPSTPVGQVFEVWVGQSPEEALAKLPELPAELRRTAASGIVQGWAQFDPMAASQWTRQLPAGAVKDGATISLVNDLRNSEPDSAFAWAASISDPSDRTTMLHKTLYGWTNKSAAGSAIEAASLSDAEKQSCFDCLNAEIFTLNVGSP